MKNALGVFGTALTTLLAAGSVSLVAAQNAAPPPSLQQTEFKPGLDDVMTMLVQPRHLKLHVAAEQQNWELAAFQLKELRSSFRRIGQYIPQYHGKAFDEAVATILNTDLQQVEDAIKAKDPRKFATAYANLTDGCNACHHYMDHPFLVVTVPRGNSASLFPSQGFSVQK